MTKKLIHEYIENHEKKIPQYKMMEKMLNQIMVYTLRMDTIYQNYIESSDDDELSADYDNN